MPTNRKRLDDYYFFSLLIYSKVNPNKRHSLLLNRLLETVEDMTIETDEEQYSALHYAIRYGQVNSARILIEKFRCGNRENEQQNIF